MHLACEPLQQCKKSNFAAKPHGSCVSTLRAARVSRVSASMPTHDAKPSAAASDRRAALMMLAASAAGVALQGGFPSASEAKGGASTRTAGDFCPPSSTEGFVTYKPDLRATPSLRAGVIKPNPELYSFDLPPSWGEGTILNILSGNFCMPKCDEPWYETLWQSKEEGIAQLVITPFFRLIPKQNATLKDLGPPEQVVESIGPFITGNYLDSVEDVTSSTVETFSDGRIYYSYELLTPYAKTGQHLLAAFCVKGDLAYLWVVGGSQAQWQKNEQKYRHMLKSFTA